MSRVGKKLIAIPGGAEVKIDGRNVSVKGPKGTLNLTIHPVAKAVITEESGVTSIKVTVDDEKNVKQRALWGLTARLIANMVEGVTRGYEKKLEINGVGFRAAVSGSNLKLEVGFSHPILFPFPKGISVTVEKNIITISGADKQSVGEISAQIRKIKKPEPYKGKGIKYVGEVIRRKAGKAVKAAA